MRPRDKSIADHSVECYSLRVLRIVAISFTLLFALATLAPVQGLSQPVLPAYQSAQLVSKPDVRPPSEFGIRGDVRVLVSLDKEGNVKGVLDVTGPGSVCRQVTRPDIRALRRTAMDAAVMAKFNPATQNGVPVESASWLTFTFPVQKTDSDEKKPTEQNSVPESSNAKSTVVAQPQTGRAHEWQESNGGLIAGKPISIPKPPYPPAARSVRAEGQVKIRVLIDERGEIYSAEAIEGHPLLAPAAVTAACRATFSPTLLQNIPVKVIGVINYNFVP